MASADLRAELECPICLDIYTDPVTLTCGHNFCRACIDPVLNAQVGSRGYSCPECRVKFKDRPGLQRNLKLRNIVENFLSAYLKPDLEESAVICTYCVDSPVAAVRSCVLCEAFLCDKHLKVHSKSLEHVLYDPTMSLQGRKCSIHKKVLDYFCTEDSTYICASCCLTGDCKGHKVEPLDKASEKRKDELRNVLQDVTTQKEEMEAKIQSFRKQLKKVQEQADGETKRVTALFRELRRKLEDLEKRILSETSWQKEQISSPLTDQIHMLEKQKDELSEKMHRIEELCNMADPLTVLQESDRGDLCGTDDGYYKDRGRGHKLLHDGSDLDVFRISHTFHTCLSDIITWVNSGIHIPEPADIFLDESTASSNLQISDDWKTASWSYDRQNPLMRFYDLAQVISIQSFSSGRHYWDVDVGQSRLWRIGVCYPSLDRGAQSWIGKNNKSWAMGVKSGLFNHLALLLNLQCSNTVVIHDNKETPLPDDRSADRVRIYVDYEAGQISFYNVSNPIQHLHTFYANFTEPLHAALWVENGHIKILETGEHDT